MTTTTATTPGKKLRGRPSHANPGKLFTENAIIRLKAAEKEKLLAYTSEHDISISDLFRGYLHKLPAHRQPAPNMLKITVDDSQIPVTRENAKKILRELTRQLLEG